MKSLQTEKGMQYSYEKPHTVQANSGSWDKSSRVYHPVAPYLRLWLGKSSVFGLCRSQRNSRLYRREIPCMLWSLSHQQRQCRDLKDFLYTIIRYCNFRPGEVLCMATMMRFRYPILTGHPLLHNLNIPLNLRRERLGIRKLH